MPAPALPGWRLFIGALAACSASVGMRKRPSLLTSYERPPRRVSKSAFGTPASNLALLFTSTARSPKSLQHPHVRLRFRTNDHRKDVASGALPVALGSPADVDSRKRRSYIPTEGEPECG